MENKKISVIIPCYNVEQYICKCIESIIQQSYRNIELILVDDGSSDKTGRICDRYALKDKRITVIHKENGGQASARNEGLRIATGEYIFFADSDDWIVKKTLGYLMNLITLYQGQCAIGRTVKVQDSNGVLKYGEKVNMPDKLIDSTESIRMVLLYGSGAVNKLIKRDMLTDIRFKDGIINEDEPFMLEVYNKLERIVLGGRQTYFYRARKNSTTRSKFSIRNLDFYYNTKANVSFIEKYRPELTEYAVARHFKAAAYCAVKLHIYLKGDEGDKYRREIKQELKDNRMQIVRNSKISFLYKVIGLIFSVV
jgi:glycosyltransferase involved in cell wall biosynthesis